MADKACPKKWFWIIPDLLTVSRLLLGLAIGIMGPLAGRGGLYFVLAFLLLGWTTDLVDGHLARQIRGYCSTKIGQNEIRFDTILVVGTFIYLGYVHFLPLGIAVSSAALLFILAILPVVSYKQIFFFEAPAAIASFLLIVALAGKPTLGYVVLWGVLVLIYNWSRAMELGGNLKSLLLTTARRMGQVSLARNLFFGGLVVLLLTLLVYLEMATAWGWLGKSLVGLILAFVLLIWKKHIDKIPK